VLRLKHERYESSKRCRTSSYRVETNKLCSVMLCFAASSRGEDKRRKMQRRRTFLCSYLQLSTIFTFYFTLLSYYYTFYRPSIKLLLHILSTNYDNIVRILNINSLYSIHSYNFIYSFLLILK